MADEICYTRDEDKSWLENAIDDIDRNIWKCQNAQDALIRFRESVRAAERNFNEANDHRRNILSDLSYAASRNDVLKKYQKGMGNSLTGVGMAGVDLAFKGLLIQINLKIVDYSNRIAGLKIDRGFKQKALDLFG